MARGSIVEIPQETAIALLTKVLAICSSEARTYSEVFTDDMVNALREEYGERIIREHITSMVKLGFLKKSSITHSRLSTTKQGEMVIGKAKWSRMGMSSL
jgi:repressor of nif and glnA expression